MKIKIIKSNSFYVAGTIVDVPEGRGEYLVRIRIAEPVKEIQNPDYQETSLEEIPGEKTEEPFLNENFVWPTINNETEKVEVKAPKEKAENRTGNVPTAKPAKKDSILITRDDIEKMKEAHNLKTKKKKK